MSTTRSSVSWCTSSSLVFALLLPGPAQAGSEEGGPGVLARGAEIFSREWLPDDPRSRAGDGLGPVYNETSCIGCHGLGAPGGAGPVNKNAVILSLARSDLRQRVGPDDDKDRLAGIHPGFLKARSVVLHRFGTDPDYAGWLRALSPATGAEPLANRASARKTPPEASAEVTQEIERFVQDAPSLSRSVTVSRSDQTFRLLVSERNTPALFGAGLIDAVPAEVLARTAAAQDAAIRGRVAHRGEGRVGRFGWKAQTATLREFVLVACANELGLSVPGHFQAASPLDPGAPFKGLDLSQSDCDALIAYVRCLPAPVALRPSSPGGAQVLDEGRKLFESVGCAGCHTPDLGPLRGVYTDLLLHNMGPSLSDGSRSYGGGISPGDARPAEWRTPPLWGFRDSGPYLHDGRARTLEEAVAHHGGQGGASALRYFELSPGSRLRIQAFLKSLVAPPADPIAAVLYATEGEAREARQRRAETEQKFLEESLDDSRRTAEEALVQLGRITEEQRAEASRRERAASAAAAAALLRAETRLRAAQSLERLGKIPAALEYYREIVHDVPDSAPGRSAAERIAALKH
jgi:CxxC motif-containing protein (DUF1111 family)